MKRWAWLWLVTATLAVAGSFPTNSNTAILDLSNRTTDWSDFLFVIREYESQQFTFTVTNSSGYVDLTGFYAEFKATQRVSGGTNQLALSRAANEITVAGSNVTFTLAATNIPSRGLYRCELFGYEGATTNSTLMLGHGTLDIRESLHN